MTNVSINEGTQTTIATDTVGTVNYQVIKLDVGSSGASSPFTGTIAAVSSLAAGSVAVTAGTVTAGTVNLVTRTGNVGTLEAGTITTLPNIPGGTITNLISGTINSATAVLNSGTINVATAVITTLPNTPGGTLGLVSTVTTVSNVTNGSIVVTAGTVAAHAITAATITEGTLRNLISGTINSATVVINSATISVMPNTPGGTLGLITRTGNVGTLESGTIRVNPNPTIVSTTYGTTSAGTIGTIIAAPSAGSAIFLTGLEVSVQSGTVEPVVSFGLAANGNGVMSRGLYTPGGGVYKAFTPANSGSNTGTALTWNVLTSSGTVSYVVSYFIAVP